MIDPNNHTELERAIRPLVDVLEQTRKRINEAKKTSAYQEALQADVAASAFHQTPARYADAAAIMEAVLYYLGHASDRSNDQLLDGVMEAAALLMTAVGNGPKVPLLEHFGDVILDITQADLADEMMKDALHSGADEMRLMSFAMIRGLAGLVTKTGLGPIQNRDKAYEALSRANDALYEALCLAYPQMVDENEMRIASLLMSIQDGQGSLLQ